MGTSRLTSGYRAFVKSKSASINCHFPHKILAQLCYKKHVFSSLTGEGRRRHSYKSSRGVKHRRPGRLTTCVNGLGFQRQTCLQPQECTAVLARTLLLNLFCFYVHCNELVVDVSTAYSIHTGVTKNGAATWWKLQLANPEAFDTLGRRTLVPTKQCNLAETSPITIWQRALRNLCRIENAYDTCILCMVIEINF